MRIFSGYSEPKFNSATKPFFMIAGSCPSQGAITYPCIWVSRVLLLGAFALLNSSLAASGGKREMHEMENSFRWASRGIALELGKLSYDLFPDRQNPLSIGLGNFLYADTDLTSPFSSMLREELEQALGEVSGLFGFRLVARDRLGDLQIELKFQGNSGLGLSSHSDQPITKGVDLFVRGRFYLNDDIVTIYAQLVRISDGEIVRTQKFVRASHVGVQIVPNSEQLQGVE